MSSFRNLLTIGTLFGITAFDTLLLAFALPSLIVDYGLTPSSAGFLGTILMSGVAIGSVILGGLSDTIGRKRVILFSVLVFTLSTGLLALAKEYTLFAVLSLTSGFGLGGGLTLSIAYLPELVNDLEKNMCYFESFWGVGALCITIVYLFVKKLPELFVVGALPIVFLPLFYKLPDFKGSKKSVIGNVKDLVSRYLKVTLILWIVWFCGVFTYYGIFLWLPSVVSQKMFGSFMLIPIYGIQVISPLVLSRIIQDDITKLLTIYSIVAAFTTLLSMCSEFLMFVGMLTTSFFSIGGWVLLILLTQKSYPQSIRGLGVGSAASFGRLGGIIAPYLTGFLIEKFGFELPLMMFAFLFVSMAVLVFFGVDYKSKNFKYL